MNLFWGGLFSGAMLVWGIVGFETGGVSTEVTRGRELPFKAHQSCCYLLLPTSCHRSSFNSVHVQSNIPELLMMDKVRYGNHLGWGKLLVNHINWFSRFWPTIGPKERVVFQRSMNFSSHFLDFLFGWFQPPFVRIGHKQYGTRIVEAPKQCKSVNSSFFL